MAGSSTLGGSGIGGGQGTASNRETTISIGVRLNQQQFQATLIDAQRRIQEINNRTSKIQQVASFASNPAIRAAQEQSAADQRSVANRMRTAHLDSAIGQQQLIAQRREQQHLSMKEAAVSRIAKYGRIGSGIAAVGEMAGNIGMTAGLSGVAMGALAGSASPDSMATLTGSWRLFAATIGQSFLPAMATASGLIQRVTYLIDQMPSGVKQAGGSFFSNGPRQG